MRHLKSCLVVVAVGLLGAACGGKSPAPVTAENTGAPTATPPSSATPPTPATPTTDTPAASATAASKDPPAATKPAYDDPSEVEHGGVITMTPLLKKGMPKSTYPKKTVGDKECWQGTSLQGDAKKDFDAIIGKCGAPTGLAEYAKPVLGKLHHIHDKRDTFKLKLAGGMCYRYFAVADAGIKDLDILVTKPGGALVADDKTSHPVAIIEFDKSWCMDDDAEYDFHIEVDGEGTGNYMFGVWAKPKG
jgi:hypothetical protein